MSHERSRYYDKQTVGEFLLEKMVNMNKWLSKEFAHTLHVPLTPTLCVIIAARIVEHKHLIVQRDLQGLLDVINHQLNDATYREMGKKLLTRVDLHDKFWRYMECFCQAIE
ncbi:MAG: hypothetical protein ACO3X4_05595, partial [Pelagibacteraceae bacterium]